MNKADINNGHRFYNNENLDLNTLKFEAYNSIKRGCFNCKG